MKAAEVKIHAKVNKYNSSDVDNYVCIGTFRVGSSK